jgi:hypothetical protein
MRISPLPFKLSDEDKRLVAQRLVRDGYLIKDQAGRYLLTELGNAAGLMLFACAAWHERESASWQTPLHHGRLAPMCTKADDRGRQAKAGGRHRQPVALSSTLRRVPRSAPCPQRH